ncbi:myosin light chain kinase 3 isoform X1 [Spea bombifrons]|uniref:myosin light chain kinase 3 isoform X1 n=1 Tax=Spea bombifrons TaxID=233779 RepID=UPI00234BF5EA|nr:myosin light chain kinase 3 isoform X1 [Spea bombifrons]
MSKQDSIASCLAKIYESKLESTKGPGSLVSKSPAPVNSMEKKLNLLNEKVDKLLHFQEDVMGKLETVYHGIDSVERGIDKLSVFHGPVHPNVPEIQVDLRDKSKEVRENDASSELVQLLKRIHENSVIHREKLDSLEKMVSTMDKVVEFVGNTLRNSKILDFILKGAVPWRKETEVEAKDNSEEKEPKTQNAVGSRGVKVDVKSPDGDSKTTGALGDRGLKQKTALRGGSQTKVQSTGQGQVQEESKHGCAVRGKNAAAERSVEKAAGNNPPVLYQQPVSSHGIDHGSRQEEHCKQAGNHEESSSSHIQCPIPSASPATNESVCLEQPAREGSCARKFKTSEVGEENQKRNPHGCTVSEQGQLQDKVKPKPGVQRTDNVISEEKQPSQKAGKPKASCNKNKKSSKSLETPVTDQAGDPEKGEVPSAQRSAKDGARPQKGESPNEELATDQPHGSTGTADPSAQPETPSLHVIDDCPPPPAPFNHRIVTIKQAILSSCYTVCQHEVLGGGRFGQVHKCVEKTSGLRLAAKMIRVKGPKDRDEVKNEINIMNHLNHVNLIQLYDAFECKNDLTLIMECLDGGELFDRITDENYSLTELDAIMFTKQICEGVYYLHQQYILHLDLKPENILCVSRTGNQIKIIDFGLARRYKPREKLRVNFGTPEFLAPEVVNYDFVSFPTDMWSVGVITYMLLSGLSPFLGESDAETMNYIVNCNWDFDSETFEQVSEEAKDFISRLLLKEKSCRLSAGQCLKHEWLVSLPLKAKKYNIRLKSQVLLQRYLMQKKWKKHFYVVTAANRLRKFQLLSLKPS